MFQIIGDNHERMRERDTLSLLSMKSRVSREVKMTKAQFFCSIPMLSVLGLFIGSFINLVVHRLPKKMEREWAQDARDLLGVAPQSTTILSDHGVVTGSMSGRSACPHCKTQIKNLLLTPVLGWFFTKGRCSNCGVGISKRYPIIEAFTSFIFALVAWRIGPHPMVYALAGLMAALIALALIDADTMLLPDIIVLPLMWSGILLAASGYGFISLRDSVFGAAVGYMALWLICEGFRLATGRVGLGNGDMKLLAAGGAWLGWIALIDVVLMSSIVGAAFGIFKILSKKMDRGAVMPFGPYLALAIGLTVFLKYPFLIWSITKI